MAQAGGALSINAKTVAARRQVYADDMDLLARDTSLASKMIGWFRRCAFRMRDVRKDDVFHRLILNIQPQV